MIDDNKAKELIEIGRKFIKGYSGNDEFMDEYKSDQDLKKPQPPLTKAALDNSEKIELPRNFKNLNINNDFLEVLSKRKSSRVYTKENMSLLQLSYLLWATQGVRGIRGKNYATLRTVPCGGARHEFETYLIVMNVEDLKQGVYHYLPLDHKLEFVKTVDDIEKTVGESLSGQIWANKANVVFYWSIDCYRVEWRYGIYAHRPALTDVGHIGQNLYLACSSIGLGVCGIAAFENDICNRLFDLDGDNEFVCYTAPVGTIKEEDFDKEQAFYSFLDEE